MTQQDTENWTQSKNLFCFWADDNSMSDIRKKCLDSLPNTGMNVQFLNKAAITEWALADFPFHEGYKFLSSTHKSDYLRAYFMHHYGGGYTDIKYLDYSWLPALDSLVNSENYIEGYPEVGILGITRKKGMLFFLQHAIKVNKLIGCGAFICKPYTPFTELWIKNIHSIIDNKFDSLEVNPASGPLDYINMKLADGSKSQYPFTHSAFSGENFHPVCMQFLDKIGRNLKTPDFKIDYK